MESNKKSFWDSLGELLGSLSQLAFILVIILFIVGLIAHIFDFFKDIIRGDKTKLVKLGVWILFIICIWYYFPKTDPKSAYQPESVSKYDTLSGQEIWNNNMKDYNAERGY